MYANDLMKFAEVELAHLYNESVLWKVKQLDPDEKLNLGKINDPVTYKQMICASIEIQSQIVWYYSWDRFG